jgi:DNA-binding MarR family transcriptional regulator
LDNDLAGPRAGPDTADGPDLGPLPHLVAYALRRTHIAVFNRFRRVFSEFDIRPAQLGALTILANNPGLKQSEVSAVLGIKRTNFGPLLDGLVARGLVRRAKVPTDRRAFGLHLTDEGRALITQLHARERAFEAEITAVIGEDGRRDLLALLQGVAATCRDEGDEPDQS